MRKTGWLLSFAAAAMVLAIALPARLWAQGITTAAITGKVVDSTSGEPIDAALVQVVNKSTGAAVVGQTRPSGVYFVGGLQVGDEYTVTVRRIGYKSDAKDASRLSLGQRVTVDFALTPQAATLAAVTVSGGTQAQPVINSNRRGTASLVDDSILKRSPTLNRNFTDFMNTVPQLTKAGAGTTGGTSAGGVNSRYNNIQIDGGSENDLYGLGSTGQPGGQSNGKSISLEAVKEYQVLLSPYDLRYGNFTGALVNAVTKSGTNELTGSLFYYFRNQDLSANVPFIRQSGLYVEQYGFSVGGPIMKDRLHYFVASEWQGRSQPAPGPYVGQAANAASPLTVDPAIVQRFMNDLTAYGIPPGTGGAASLPNPLLNVFARLDLALPEINSTFTLRDNYGTADLDVFSRTSASTFQLTSQLYTIADKKNSIVAQLHSTMKGGMENEFILGYSSITDNRDPSAGVYPQVTAVVPGLQSATVNLVAGAEQFSQGNSLSQKILELKDNFSFFASDLHRVTAGISFEFWKFSNLFTESSYGVWTFNSLNPQFTLDSLEAGIAHGYRVSAPIPPGNNVLAEPQGATYGIYVMDNWTPSHNFNLLYGLRIDVPTITNSPPYTAQFNTVYGTLFASMGRDANTSQVPTGNVQYEPRVGFNWDVTGDSRNQLRGGIGVFVGRPVYVWVSNSWQNSGSGLGFIQCGQNLAGVVAGPSAPAFNPDATAQPQTCPNGAGFGTGVVGPVDIMDKNLKYPEVLRGNIAFDKKLPGDFFLTLEALYTKGLNNFFYVNRVLDYDSAYTGRNGRVMYGNYSAGGGVTPFSYEFDYTTATTGTGTRNFSEVMDIVNQSKDYSYNLTIELQKRVMKSLDMRVAYTYSHSYDVQSLGSSRAVSNWNFGRPEGGDLLATNTGVSIYDQPNKLLISGTYTFPWEKWRTDFSLIYQGYSGQPFDYVYGGRGDLNADGNANDLIYVPKNVFDPTEIQFVPIAASGGKAAILPQTQQLALYNLIQSTPCLRNNQGRILPRNACQNPWVNTFDATIIQSLPQVSGHTMSLRLDIFNLPNLLNNQWGRQRLAGANSDVNNLLNVVGASVPINSANPTAGIPVVQFQPAYVQYPIQNVVTNYYQLQFSARVDF